MEKTIICAYATNHGLNMMTQADARRLTHINLAFGVLKKGLLSIDGLPDIGRIAVIRQWNPDIRIVLSVGGWGAGGFSTMAMTEGGREAFTKSVAEAMDRHGLDGVDIDWEYPCNGSADIDFDPRDRENFTLLLSSLRNAAGNRIVSIAAGAGAYFVRDTEMDKVAALCDYVQLMTYDMRSGFCREAGHHTSLYHTVGDSQRIGTRTTVDLFAAAGVPKNKLVIGCAFYSRRWDGVPCANRGLLQQAQTVGQFGAGYAELARDYIDQNGWTRYWDDDAKAPFLFNGASLISYDDPDSLRHKCAYLQSEGLRGIMYWEHSCDDTHTLLQAIHEALG